MGEFLRMPKLDMTMAKGTIVLWLANEGAYVNTGDYIVEVETGKVSIQVDSTAKNGILLRKYFDAGDTVKIGTPIAYIGKEGEEIPPIPENRGEQNGSSEEVSSYEYDAAIIGGGPGGYNCALRCSQLGKKAVIIEKGELGGTCLNKGCIPTKSLIKNAYVLNMIKNSANMGIRFENLSADYTCAVKRKDSVVAQIRSDMGKVLAHNGIEVIKDTARVASPHEIQLSDRTITAEHIIISAGSRPVKPSIPCDGSVEIYSAEEILETQKIPGDMLITNCGTIGVEFAYIFSSYGSKITIVEKEKALLSGADKDLSKFLEKQLENSGIRIIKNSEVKRCENKKVFLDSGEIIDCEILLSAEYRRVVVPNIAGTMPLDEKGFIKIDEALKTGYENVYAIGDCTGKMFTAQAASKQGIQLAENLFGTPSLINYDAIPVCIFSYPEAAWLGISEEEARARKIPIKVSKKYFSSIGKALTDDQQEGFVKVIADSRWDEILGVHIVGANATDIIAQASIAVSSELCAGDVADAAFAHPTFSEAFMYACDKIAH